MPAIKIDRELCKGCELCVYFCPKGCIRMEGFNSKGYKVSLFIGNEEDKSCSGCAVCAKVCPDVAIVEVRR